MISVQETPDSFLTEAYKSLEFSNGIGYYPIDAEVPNLSLGKVSWFAQAKELGAKAIYFVEDYPAVLFFALDKDLGENTSALEERIRNLHLKVWNTGSVPVFFVALPHELRIYSAYQKPAKTLEEWRSSNRWLDHVESLTKVIELTDFSRQMIESGRLFQKYQDEFNLNKRVDNFLLSNLRLLREKLEKGDVSKRLSVHALIGRSIFIRYLEDRRILTEDYFSIYLLLYYQSLRRIFRI